MKHFFVVMVLLTTLTTASAGQIPQCVNIFSTYSDAIIKTDTSGNHAIEYKEVVAFANSQIRMDKIINPNSEKAVVEFSRLGCGIPQNFLSANQIQMPIQTAKNNMVLGVVFIALVALIFLRTRK